MVTAKSNNKMKDTKNKGGRPALENKKKFRINVRFDEAEHKRVLQNAQTAGMSKSEWVRKSAIMRKIVPRFTEEQLKAFRAITGASNNLNQLTKKAHQTGLFEVAQECRNTIGHINQCIDILLHHDSEDH
ncbi:plasmid mobilization relaxosome protein MobC [Sphingobacterium sp. BN32]|uniref:plasmid mobilization protein n=1 Tax=Sphingobacterium sp. BN32 TaxID=3058432 RepID=UPI00265CB693|nr:plasmid mobilization relaxosome protein MobC [Sphingobacterium sp. BN32]WKK60364.1 plasmid mobilization relaxosome protein MobC [Sphingobacterium sp. BN32]